jgi:hypothetical protein
MFPCDTRDERCAYAGEVPACAKYTGTNSLERDAGVLENTISAPTGGWEHARGRRTPVETRLAIAGATLIVYRTLSRVEGKSSLFGWCGIGDGRRGTSCTQTVFSMSRQS